MHLAKPCHIIPNRVPDATGYIGVTVGGPGRGVKGQPKGRRMGAHRAAWERTYGPVPEGMWVLHHCDNRACDEPTHLFLGDHDANMADMRAKGRGSGRYAGVTHCVHGHPFTPENTREYVRDGTVRRQCRVRLRAADRRHQPKRKRRSHH